MASNRQRFLGILRSIAVRLAPETSGLYKFLYFNHVAFSSRRKLRTPQSKLTTQVTVTDACNLNCKHCVTYSPIVAQAYLLDVPSYRKDIFRLSELCAGEVEKIEFSGGEALLHPAIADILAITRESFPKGVLCMITNGLLLHKMDEVFWKCCHDNRVLIQITPYPINLNYERILELAAQHRVEVIHYTGAGYKDKSFFRKLTLNAVGDCNAIKNYKRCDYAISNCQSLRGSRLYRCAAPCFIGAFNDCFGTKFEISEKDYIDIYKVKDKAEIFDFLIKPIPFCRYCDIDKWEFGLPWGHSKKEIGEWM